MNYFPVDRKKEARKPESNPQIMNTFTHKRTAGGVVLLNKPSGITSFQALYPVKKAIPGKKIGHTGTLDKFASGLLVILTGPFTKLNQLFINFGKAYRATFTFGTQTDTLDPSGTVTKTAPPPSEDSIRSRLPEFLGNILQIPPEYSAVHVNGNRAYQLARKGREVDIPPRNIRIDEFSLVSSRNSEADFFIRCSKGTYIRALARDLGKICGSAAHVTKLERVEVGPFSLEDAVPPEKFDPHRHLLTPETFLSKISGIRSIKVSEYEKNRIGHGTPPELVLSPLSFPALYAVFGPGSELAALIDNTGDRAKYLLVIPPETK
ncbi:MAG: tRNA pseudouridine(55) synthase TruB [Spirochaetia bacterium]